MVGELDELAAAIVASQRDRETAEADDAQVTKRRRGCPLSPLSMARKRLEAAGAKPPRTRLDVNAMLVQRALEVRNAGLAVMASKRKQGGMSAQRADRIQGISKLLKQCPATDKLSDVACARWMMANDAWISTEQKLGTLRKDIAIARNLARSNRGKK